MSKTPVICPECGREMNHHANKVSYPLDTTLNEETYDGILEKHYVCPGCGFELVEEEDE